jgi:hypothetical protein
MSEENEVEAAMESFTPKTHEEIINDSLQEIIHLVGHYCSPTRTAILAPILETLSQHRKTPASSSLSYHGAFEGGLVSHIEDVIKIALGANVDANLGKIELYGKERREKFLSEVNNGNVGQSIVTVAILHDLNKIMDCSGNALYVENILKDGKRSEKKPYARNEVYEPLRNSIDTGDAIESIVLKYGGIQYSSGAVSLAVAERISPGIINDLSSSEVQAIVHHAGMYEKCSKEGYIGNENFLSIVIHYADMVASRYFS